MLQDHTWTKVNGHIYICTGDQTCTIWEWKYNTWDNKFYKPIDIDDFKGWIEAPEEEVPSLIRLRIKLGG